MSAATDRARWIALYDQALHSSAQVQTWPGHFLFKWIETQLVFRQVGISADAVGLELGCGNGFQSMLLASRCRELVSTDLLEADPHTHTVGLDRARRLLQQCGVRNVRLAAARAEALPFPDGQFDFVFSSSVLEHVSDRPKALEEMARVLKPEGLMIVAVPTHISSLCAFLHLPLYMVMRAAQVLIRKLRRKPLSAAESVESARQVREQDRVRGLGGAWAAFWRNHPRFPLPEPHGTYGSVFQELRAQFPARWRALIEAGGFRVQRSFALTLVTISLLEVLSPALMARAYQWSQPLHERTMTHPVMQSLGYIWAAVCRKPGAPIRVGQPQRQEAVAG